MLDVEKRIVPCTVLHTGLVHVLTVIVVFLLIIVLEVSLIAIVSCATSRVLSFTLSILLNTAGFTLWCVQRAEMIEDTQSTFIGHGNVEDIDIRICDTIDSI